MVINCGDAGQEGELIQRWVMTKAKCKAPVKRLWISSLTEEAIKEGFDKLMDAKDFDTLYAAGSARAIGDWLLGMNATRAYTLRYGNGKNVLSIGRVQTPTLALIVDRQKAIEQFKPETYWEVRTGRLVFLRERTFHGERGGGRLHAGDYAFGVGNQELGTQKGNGASPEIVRLDIVAGGV